MASKARKTLPRLASGATERAFSEIRDTAEYLEWTKAHLAAMSRVEPSTQTISLRLPAGMLNDLKILANTSDVPYQSQLKTFLADRIAGERPLSRGHEGTTNPTHTRDSAHRWREKPNSPPALGTRKAGHRRPAFHTAFSEPQSRLR